MPELKLPCPDCGETVTGAYRLASHRGKARCTAKRLINELTTAGWEVIYLGRQARLLSLQLPYRLEPTGEGWSKFSAKDGSGQKLYKVRNRPELWVPHTVAAILEAPRKIQVTLSQRYRAEQNMVEFAARLGHLNELGT